MDLADAHRWRGAWAALHLSRCSRRSTVADELGDVRAAGPCGLGDDRSARCGSRRATATRTTTVVAALRRALAGLPAADDALRCRVMLALANELYYSARASRSARALVEQALAMARRLGDDALRARRLPGRVRCRCGSPTPPSCGCELAQRGDGASPHGIGNERAFVVAATHDRGGARGVRPRSPRCGRWLAEAREQAERLQLPTACGARHAGAALAGDGRPLRRGRGAASTGWLGSPRTMSMPQAEDAVGRRPDHAAALAGSRRRDRAALMDAFEGGPLPITLDRCWCSCCGPATWRRARRRTPPSTRWSSTRSTGSRCSTGRCAAEAALGLGDAEPSRAAAYASSRRTPAGRLRGLRQRAGPGRRVPGARRGGRGRPRPRHPARRRRGAADGGVADPAGRAVVARPAGALRLLRPQSTYRKATASRRANRRRVSSQHQPVHGAAGLGEQLAPDRARAPRAATHGTSARTSRKATPGVEVLLRRSPPTPPG